MKLVLTLTLLTLVALPLTAQQTQPQQPQQPATPTITVTSAYTPEYTGTVFSVPQGTTGSSLHVEGKVWRVANGTTVADMDLSIKATGPAQTQGILFANNVEPTPAGIVMSEWHDANLAPLPLEFTPTSGTLANDTAYLIRYQLYVPGEPYEHFGIIILVGTPDSGDVIMTATAGGSLITAPIDVTIGTTLAAVDLDFYCSNILWESIGAYTTISGPAAGINPAEFKHYQHHSLNLPTTSTPSGTFTEPGTYTFVIQTFALKYAAQPITLTCNAKRLEVVINVLPDPVMQVQDSQGAISHGDSRDLGSHDIGTLPSSWRVVTISNSGVGDLTLTDPVLSAPFTGDGAAAFDLDLSSFSNTVPQGQSTTFGVRVAVTASAAAHGARIVIGNDDQSQPADFHIDVSADVTATPILQVSDAAGVISSGVTHDFGQVDMTTMPAAASFTVENIGSGTLVITGVSLASTIPAHFQLDLTALNQSLASGASSSFDVRFDALMVGAHTAAVSIHHAGGTFDIHVAGVAFTTNLPAIAIFRLPGGVQGQDYGPVDLPVVGGAGPYSFVPVGSMPSGLTLSSAGVVEGVPSVPGDHSFTVRVTDAWGASSEQPLDITIAYSATAASGGGGGGGSCVAGTNAAGWLLLLAAAALIMFVRPNPTRARNRA